MKTIKLTQGKVALVDDADYEWLNQWKWRYQPSRDRDGYAVRTAVYQNESMPYRQTVMMHRLINGTPEGYETDHINRNKLDNRRSNLRTASRALNRFNAPRADNKSGYPGVSWYKTTNKWRAVISINGKLVGLGYFLRIEDAIRIRQQAEQQLGL